VLCSNQLDVPAEVLERNGAYPDLHTDKTFFIASIGFFCTCAKVGVADTPLGVARCESDWPHSPASRHGRSCCRTPADISRWAGGQSGATSKHRRDSRNVIAHEMSQCKIAELDNVSTSTEGLRAYLEHGERHPMARPAQISSLQKHFFSV
jgi:hypothetical protein